MTPFVGPEKCLPISGGYDLPNSVSFLLQLHDMLGELGSRREGEKEKERTVMFLAILIQENSKIRRICECRISSTLYDLIFFCFPGQTPKPEPTPAPQDSRCFLIL